MPLFEAVKVKLQIRLPGRWKYQKCGTSAKDNWRSRTIPREKLYVLQVTKLEGWS